MGVLYADGDDVIHLLIPFVKQQGGIDDAAAIDAAYHEAMLGRISSHEFWERVGLPHSLEDQYLALFRLTEEVPALLEGAVDRYERVYCLSNDVPDWSLKLRRHFGLEPYFSGWFISGDLKLRKPDPAIFERFLADAGVAAGVVVFVDDRPKNLAAASKLGFLAVFYDPAGANPDSGFPTIRRLTELLDD